MPTISRHNQKKLQLAGWLALFGSAFFFYLATLIIHWGEAVVNISPPYYVFARFLLGFTMVCLTMLVCRQRLRPVRYHYLIGRAAGNTIAVYCFYKAVAAGSVAEGNILNMTYPLFIAVFTWIFYQNQRQWFTLVVVAVAFTGVWLVLMPPGSMAFPVHNGWGLCSGLSAASGIIYLNISRKYHDSQTILFFMFGIGGLALLAFSHNDLFWPNRTEFFYLLTCSLAGVGGQYLMTFGFRYVTALEGSIITSSRILLAAVMGPLLTLEPSLGWPGWLGAFLIFAANAALAWQHSKGSEPE